MMKRILSIFIILILCLSLCVPVVFAAEVEPDNTTTTTIETEEPEEDTPVKDTLKEWWHTYIYDIFAGGLLGQIFGEDEPEIADKIIELFEVIHGIVSEIKNKFDGDVMAPVVDFVDSISNAAVELLAPFWDFPIIKDFLIVAVTLGVFGLFIFMFVKR